MADQELEVEFDDEQSVVSSTDTDEKQPPEIDETDDNEEEEDLKLLDAMLIKSRNILIEDGKKRSKSAVKRPVCVKKQTKKGPGRPRKIPKKEPMSRNGIKTNSINPDSHIEFLYDTPIYIKKILTLFKSIAASKIQILFRPTDIIFYAIDHHKKSKMRIKINASKLNHYYCRGNLDIGILEKDLELILNKIDGSYSSMVLVSSNNSMQKSITLILENDLQIDENHNIELIGQYDHMENEDEFSDENYAISMQLPGKFFKKTIADIRTMSNQLSITQEDNTAPLVFEYSTSNSKIHSRHTANNSEKIKLQSKVPHGESFRVDVKIDYIKSISAAHISDEITIYVDENRPFMTKAYIDDGMIEIRTLTEIIDLRPTN